MCVEALMQRERGVPVSVPQKGDVRDSPQPLHSKRAFQSNESNMLQGGEGRVEAGEEKYKSAVVLPPSGKVHCFPLVPG